MHLSRTTRKIYRWVSILRGTTSSQFNRFITVGLPLGTVLRFHYCHPDGVVGDVGKRQVTYAARFPKTSKYGHVSLGRGRMVWKRLSMGGHWVFPWVLLAKMTGGPLIFKSSAIVQWLCWYVFHFLVKTLKKWQFIPWRSLLQWKVKARFSIVFFSPSYYVNWKKCLKSKFLNIFICPRMNL